MLGDLSSEIIGTDPKSPPIVNLDWLSPDIASYDNYPSDNQSVRIQPKLSEMWGDEKCTDTGINLVPNSVQPLSGARAANEDKEAIIAPIIREAKKAVMAGLKGPKLASHIRSRFNKDDIILAKSELEKVSQEIGLLGNVYIDASAFKSAKEAEEFLTQHRNRLARDILVNSDAIDPVILAHLASRFHKNVVADLHYNEDLFKRYRPYLEGSRKIAKNSVIDSKESLRLAFLSEPAEKNTDFVAEKEEKFSKDQITQGLSENFEKNAASLKLAEEELIYHSSYPIIAFIREQMSKGKKSAALKEMLRKKYASTDIKRASKYIKLAISNVFTADNMDRLVKEKHITLKMANEMKKLIKQFPVKAEEKYATEKAEKSIGVKASLYVLGNKKQVDSDLCKFAADSLRKGSTIEEVYSELVKKSSRKEANSVLPEAVKEFNESSVGLRANVFMPVSKQKVVPDLPEKQTLPDPSTIASQTEEIVSFFEGANTDIDIDMPHLSKSIDIDLGSGLSLGYDEVL